MNCAIAGLFECDLDSIVHNKYVKILRNLNAKGVFGQTRTRSETRD